MSNEPAVPNKPWFFFAIGKASLLMTATYFALALACMKIAITSHKTEIMAGVIMDLVPSSIAAFWLFRKLQTHYTKRPARIAAIVWAVLMPIFLFIALVVAQIPAGYASLLGRSLGFIEAMIGVVVITTIIGFLICSFALWVKRLEEFDQNS